MKNICRLEGISKTYVVKKMEYVIMKNLTLDIATDEVTVVLGKSGCGKTTLLRMLADLESPDAGKLTYYDHQGRAQRPRIGLVFQEPRLMPWLDVKHNIMFSQEIPDWALADKLIQLMGLEGFEDAYPAELSGGMASRVAIARALAYQPNLLLMDEPFAALDYFNRRILEEKILELYQRNKVGIIFITHDLDEALLIAKRLIVMKKGHEPLVLSMEQGYPRRLESAEMQQIKESILAAL